MATGTEAQEEPTATTARVPQNAVTRRAILLGIILIPFNCYWIMMVEGIWHSGHPTAISLAWNVVFNILILLLINLLLKRFLPPTPLPRASSSRST